MKRLLIIGTGLLGQKIAEISEFETFSTYNKDPFKIEGCKSYRLDITDELETYSLIKKLDPDFIVHTAALTNVDFCEKQKEEAWNVNVKGTENVVRACRSKLVYVSTDYVFDGEKGMYREEDEKNPVNYYGETKLEGENIVKDLEDYIIVRPSVLYGVNPVKLNFATWVIHELEKGNKIKIVRDQFNSPTLANNLAELILELIERDERGTFHTAGSVRISRYEFAKKIAKIFDLDESLIESITSDELEWIAKRPKDSSLNVEKISKIKKPLSIEESLEKMKEELE
ncbi:MAG: dTDP-4-dehydrorhamnose reductase [Methanosarcinales archaeon]